MEGRDQLFGGMLDSVIESVDRQEAEVKEKETGTKDPLKSTPKQLKGDKGDNKLKKMESTESEDNVDTPVEKKEGTSEKPKQLKAEGEKDTKLKKMEGNVPNEPKDSEDEKIKKLTEETKDVAEDVKDLIQRAKEALDGGDYPTASELCGRLTQIQSAVSEPEAATADEPVEPIENPGNTGVGMPVVGGEDEPVESKKEEDLDVRFKTWAEKTGWLQKYLQGMSDGMLDEFDNEMLIQFPELNSKLELDEGDPDYLPNWVGRVLTGKKIGEDVSDVDAEFTQFIMDDKLQEMIDTVLDKGNLKTLDEEVNEAGKKKDPKAKVRNRGEVVFPAESPKVLDDKDHFPINSETQARNALARANQYSSSPKWYKGSLTDLVKKVAGAVKKKYKGIDVSKASEKPGKG